MKLIEYIHDNWGWFTALGTSISLWAAHVNWSRVLAGLDWLRARGGLLKWLVSLVWNNNPVVKPGVVDAHQSDGSPILLDPQARLLFEQREFDAAVQRAKAQDAEIADKEVSASLKMQAQQQK